MKKFGFTLAEVLITLAIIGVVAVLTLPALMNNVGEQQYVTGFKKGLNTFTESAQLSESLTGYNYDSLKKKSEPGDTTTDDPTSLYGMLRDRLELDITSTENQSAPNQPPNYKDVSLAGTAATSNFALFLRDNTALIFANSADPTTEVDIGDDGHIAGIKAIYDTNGVKGPNMLSNCNGAVSATKDNDTNFDCADSKKRIIRDRFSVRLTGNHAIPNGPAARWAMQK